MRDAKLLGPQKQRNMKLWKRAAGAIKDKNSIWVANLSRRTSYRNPHLEAAIIKATSHDEYHVDYRNAQRVFAWIRTSPVSLKPLVCALSKRMDKTRNWVVALKGLILMHGVFCCKIQAVQRIGRLPFDLSDFNDGHSAFDDSWGFNTFIRAYYAFLDQRSAFLYEVVQTTTTNKPGDQPLLQELVKLQRWQVLLDLLLEIKPESRNMNVTLILEAMDCIIIEIYDVYSRICSGVARVLMAIYSAKKLEVALALRVLQKATEQSQQISLFFQFCREFGVLNSMDHLPKVIHIPEEDIQILQRIVGGGGDEEDDQGSSSSVSEEIKYIDKAAILVKETTSGDNNNYFIDDDHEQEKKMDRSLTMRTIITDQWEVFDEEITKETVNEGIDHDKGKDNSIIIGTEPVAAAKNPFLDEELLQIVPVTTVVCANKYDDIPDLISL